MGGQVAVNTLKLNGTTLVQCRTYQVRNEWLGGATVLGSGAIRRDLVANGARRRFSLTWDGITKADLDAISGAFAYAVAGDVKFIPPDATETTVNAGERPTFSFEGYKVAGGELRYRCSCELYET
jgi:hypothetical protein